MNIFIKNVSKHFNGQVILNDFNAEIAEKKTTVLMGESGLGKTTLLRMIAGLDKDFTGSIQNVPERFTFLFQEDALLPWRTVRENIGFAVKDIYEKDEIDAKVLDLLAVTFLSGHVDKYPKELSGGMQRRVALCRALIYPSELLLLDEPFSGLDFAMKNKIVDAVLTRLGSRKTIVVVTHDESVVERCDEKILLDSH